MPSEIPRQLLEYLAEGLVDDPDAVSVEQFEEDDGTIVLELCVAAGDYGKVIGRGGQGESPRAHRHRRLTWLPPPAPAASGWTPATSAAPTASTAPST